MLRSKCECSPERNPYSGRFTFLLLRYHATIQDGILLCTGHTDVTPFKAYENIESIAYITEEYGKEYRSLMEKSYLWMYHQIPQNRDSLTMLAGPFTFNFLLQYYTKFDEDTTIIITDPSLSRIAKFQEYLQDAASAIIYIAGDLDAVPLCAEPSIYTWMIFPLTTAFSPTTVRPTMSSHTGLQKTRR